MTDSLTCWDCGKSLDAQDRYCRNCGQGQGEFVPWYYSRFGIFLLTILGLGPGSLYFIWKSPKLTPMGKWIGTALILLFTVYIVYAFMTTLALLKKALTGAL